MNLGEAIPAEQKIPMPTFFSLLEEKATGFRILGNTFFKIKIIKNHLFRTLIWCGQMKVTTEISQ